MREKYEATAVQRSIVQLMSLHEIAVSRPHLDGVFVKSLKRQIADLIEALSGNFASFSE